MDELRWILLGIGAVFILGIYWWGRSKKSASDDYSHMPVEDIPPLTVKESDDDWKDGVGPVRVISSDTPDAPSVRPDDTESVISRSEPEPDVASVYEPEPVVDDTESEQPLTRQESAEPAVDSLDEDSELQLEGADTDIAQADNTAPVEDIDVSDVIVLYLVAQRGEFIKGEQILSATYASALEYGDMNIFHRKDEQQKILFSLADMLDPGSFDIDNMHEHRTRGMSLFIQLDLCDDPVRALDDMLICAHNLATMLSLQICDQNRQLLNESVAAALRSKAKQIRDARKH